jgi:uncharacterized protein (TIGR03435 family)
MVRTLLEERFQLRWRLQSRNVDGYLLMPAREDGRPGEGLRPFTGECDARVNNPAVRFENPEYEERARCNWSGMMGRQRGVGVPMTAIAERLTLLLTTPCPTGPDGRVCSRSTSSPAPTSCRSTPAGDGPRRAAAG